MQSAAAALGHLLTAGRVTVSPWIFLWIVDGQHAAAAPALALAMLSDLLDGPLVRRFGVPTRAGAWFDICADLALVTSAFAGFALAGMLPVWPLWGIGASFIAFAATARRQLYDPLGRSIGGLLMAAALGVLLKPDFAIQLALGWMVCIACGLTIVARLLAVARAPSGG